MDKGQCAGTGEMSVMALGNVNVLTGQREGLPPFRVVRILYSVSWPCGCHGDMIMQLGMN